MPEPILVHLNVVRPVGPFRADAPEAAYFFDALPKVFAATRGVRGLLWHDHATRLPSGRYVSPSELMALETSGTQDNPHIMTIAGWEDLAALQRFSYRDPSHAAGIQRLRDWVDRSEGPTTALWWAPRGPWPTPEAAWDRLTRLRRDGPGPEAFTLRARFTPDGAPEPRHAAGG